MNKKAEKTMKKLINMLNYALKGMTYKRLRKLTDRDLLDIYERQGGTKAEIILKYSCLDILKERHKIINRYKESEEPLRMFLYRNLIIQ